MIELSRTQDEEVGDGTTSVIILGVLSRLVYTPLHDCLCRSRENGAHFHAAKATPCLRKTGTRNKNLLLFAAGEMLHMAEPFLARNVHPTVIVRGYVKALEDAIKIVDDLSFPIDVNDRSQMLKIVNSCIGTKFTNQFGNLMAVRLAHEPHMWTHMLDIKTWLICYVQATPATLNAQPSVLSGLTLSCSANFVPCLNVFSICSALNTLPAFIPLNNHIAQSDTGKFEPQLFKIMCCVCSCTEAVTVLLPMQELSLDAVTTVMAETGNGQREIDIKKYVKIEKIPGGAIEDCRSGMPAAERTPTCRTPSNSSLTKLLPSRKPCGPAGRSQPKR